MKRRLTSTDYSIILKKNIFNRAHLNPNVSVKARPDFEFSAVHCHPPAPHPESQTRYLHIYYIYYVSIITHLPAK